LVHVLKEVVDFISDLDIYINSPTSDIDDMVLGLEDVALFDIVESGDGNIEVVGGGMSLLGCEDVANPSCKCGPHLAIAAPEVRDVGLTCRG